MFFRLFFLLLMINQFAYAESSNARLEEYQAQSMQYKKLSKSFSALIKEPAQSISTKQQKPVLIYFINPSVQLSDYWRRTQIAFESRLNELGIKYVIKTHDIKIQSPERQKLKLLRRALSHEPDFIVLTLDNGPEVKLIENMFKSTNTRLILLNVTTPIASWGGFQPLIYVGFDHVIGTQMLADYFSHHFIDNSQFAVNNFYPSYISRARGQSFIDSIEKNTNFILKSHVHTEATHGSARMSTKELVSKYPELNFIYASSTDIALGTSYALKSLGRSDIKVNGWGGGSDELEALSRDELAVTVMRMNDDSGVAMAEAIKFNLEHKEDVIPLVYSGEFKLITSEINLDQIKALKEYAFRYSGLEAL